METKLDNATFIYKNGEMVGFIKRDDKTRKHLVYTCKEAKSDDISKLIGEQPIIDKVLDRKVSKNLAEEIELINGK